MRVRSFREHAEDGALVLGGAAAILLQVADPVVAHGVARHSAFRRDPVGRLRGTLGYVYAVSLGEDELAALAARHVDRAHAGVPGAIEAEHQLWVAATLYWAGTAVRARLDGAIPAALDDEIYAASGRLGTALQLPPEAWPTDRAAFAVYWDRRLDGLEVGEDALGVARDLLHPRVGPVWLLAAMPLARLLTAALLPDRIREAYRLPWSAARARRAAVALRVIRALLAVTPRRLRSLPARRLLAGMRARGTAR